MCDRKACESTSRNWFRIWNDPTTEKRYREYCRKCGGKIIQFNNEDVERGLLPKYDKLKHEVINENTSVCESGLPSRQAKL